MAKSDKMKPQQIASCICLVGAIVVAASGNNNWGWFIFFAILAW